MDHIEEIRERIKQLEGQAAQFEDQLKTEYKHTVQDLGTMAEGAVHLLSSL